MTAITRVGVRPRPSAPTTTSSATPVGTMLDADGRHASADAWDAFHGEMDRAFRHQGRATGGVRSAARRIAAEMLAVGASPADVRDALRRSVCRHSLEVALELGRDTEAWAASGARGGSFLADVLQCVTPHAAAQRGALRA